MRHENGEPIPSHRTEPPSFAGTLLICDSFRKEAKEYLRQRGYGQVSVETYPTLCHLAKPMGRVIESHIKGRPDERRHPCVLIGGCGGLPPTTGDLSSVSYWPRHCVYFLLPRSEIDRRVREGEYLLSPGWLMHWKQVMDEWGFDEEVARRFFSESARSLALLDTGLYATAAEELAAMARFTNLPFTTVPVGVERIFRVFDKAIAHLQRKAVA